MIMAKPRKLRLSVAEDALGQHCIASIFFGSTLIPSLDTKWPKNTTESSQNSHFENFAYNLFFSQGLEHNPQMMLMILPVTGVHQNVVNKHNDE